MRNADAMKLDRDGQLAYGRPDPVTVRLRACAANGHREHGSIEYLSGVHRCMGCLQDFYPKKNAHVVELTTRRQGA